MSTKCLFLGANGNMSDGVTLMVVGMVVVFVGLSVMALLLIALKRLVGGASVERPAHDLVEAKDAPGIPQHHLVVISAAVSAAVRGPARIHKITLIGREAGRPWVTEGRVTIMGSHRPHRGW